MNVLIADDQTLFRDMMLNLLEKEPDISHIGSVSNGFAAVAFCTSRQVDLVLMDIRMPEMDGITAARKLKEASPRTKVILLTAFEERDLTGLSTIDNIFCVLLKDIHAEQLMQLIRLSSQDLFIVDRQCLSALSSSIKTTDECVKDADHCGNTDFSSLDLQILKCLTKGMSNKEIAETINYSEGTVKSHLSHLLAETALKDRTQLALFALKHHLVQ